MTRISMTRLYALPAVVALTLACTCLATQAADASASVTVKTGAGLYAPASAPAVRFADVQLQAHTLRSGEALALRIEAAGAEARTLALPDEMQQAVSLHRHGDRIVVVGWMNGSLAACIAVVDWRRGVLVDRYWAYAPAVSPDGAHVAFVRFYPSHFVRGEESQYRLYATAASPNANRSAVPAGLPGASPDVDVGVAVYPLATAERWRGNVEVPAASAHQRLSPLVWAPNSRRFAFIDAQGQRVRLVVVDVTDATAPRTYAHALTGVDALCLPTLGGKGCPALPLEAVTLRHTQGGVEISVPDSAVPSAGAKQRKQLVPAAMLLPVDQT